MAFTDSKIIPSITCNDSPTYDVSTRDNIYTGKMVDWKTLQRDSYPAEVASNVQKTTDCVTNVQMIINNNRSECTDSTTQDENKSEPRSCGSRESCTTERDTASVSQISKIEQTTMKENEYRCTESNKPSDNIEGVKSPCNPCPVTTRSFKLTFTSERSPSPATCQHSNQQQEKCPNRPKKSCDKKTKKRKGAHKKCVQQCESLEKALLDIQDHISQVLCKSQEVMPCQSRKVAKQKARRYSEYSDSHNRFGVETAPVMKMRKAEVKDQYGQRTNSQDTFGASRGNYFSRNRKINSPQNSSKRFREQPCNSPRGSLNGDTLLDKKVHIPSHNCECCPSADISVQYRRCCQNYQPECAGKCSCRTLTRDTVPENMGATAGKNKSMSCDPPDYVDKRIVRFDHDIYTRRNVMDPQRKRDTAMSESFSPGHEINRWPKERFGDCLEQKEWQPTRKYYLPPQGSPMFESKPFCGEGLHESLENRGFGDMADFYSERTPCKTPMFSPRLSPPRAESDRYKDNDFSSLLNNVEDWCSSKVTNRESPVSSKCAAQDDITQCSSPCQRETSTPKVLVIINHGASSQQLAHPREISKRSSPPKGTLDFSNMNMMGFNSCSPESSVSSQGSDIKFGSGTPDGADSPPDDDNAQTLPLPPGVLLLTTSQCASSQSEEVIFLDKNTLEESHADEVSLCDFENLPYRTLRDAQDKENQGLKQSRYRDKEPALNRNTRDKYSERRPHHQEKTYPRAVDITGQVNNCPHGMSFRYNDKCKACYADQAAGRVDKDGGFLPQCVSPCDTHCFFRPASGVNNNEYSITTYTEPAQEANRDVHLVSHADKPQPCNTSTIPCYNEMSDSKQSKCQQTELMDACPDSAEHFSVNSASQTTRDLQTMPPTELDRWSGNKVSGQGMSNPSRRAKLTCGCDADHNLVSSSSPEFNRGKCDRCRSDRTLVNKVQSIFPGWERALLMMSLLMIAVCFFPRLYGAVCNSSYSSSLLKKRGPVPL